MEFEPLRMDGIGPELARAPQGGIATVELRLNGERTSDVDRGRDRGRDCEPANGVEHDGSQRPSRDSCLRLQQRDDTGSSMDTVSSGLAKTAVTPFLRDHIPGIYAPIGKDNSSTSSVMKQEKNPNSKFCYRHRPDAKCRRAADESRMAMIQQDLEQLPSTDQQAINTVWSLFSAAPSRQRFLMLEGIITQCCFPQLSMISRHVHDQLKIDFLSVLPSEISLRILCFLDTVSLCKAAQVSRRWRMLADDDGVWHRMCEQHIDRKCTKCGWGLPLLERKRLRTWKRQKQLAQGAEHAEAGESAGGDDGGLAARASPPKRDSPAAPEQPSAKRPRVNGDSTIALPQSKRPMTWKSIYRDRFKVGSNWKYGRARIRNFSGHSNGVTCLQFDTALSVLCTGSYDSTVKIWNMETGEEIRTLRGHTSGIRTLQFDERKLITGSLDKTMKIWEWQTGECLSTLQCHQDGVITLHFDGEFLASGSLDGSIRIMNFQTNVSFCLKGHDDCVNHVRLDLLSRTLFSASDDLTVKMWDLDTRTCLRTYEGHVGHVQQILLMPDDFEPDEVPDGSQENGDAVSIASGRSGTPAAVSHRVNPFATIPSIHPDHANKTNGAAQLQQQQSEERALYGDAFASDPERHLPPRYMFTGSLDNVIRVWDTATGVCLRKMFGHVEGIWSMAGSALRVVTGANDSVLKVWEPRSGKCDLTIARHSGPVTSVGVSDGCMASGSEDGEVLLYSFECDGNQAEECGTPS